MIVRLRNITFRNRVIRLKLKVYEGSITVEASLLYPMIIMLFYGIIYMNFYLHDRTKIDGMINHTLYKICSEQTYIGTDVEIEVAQIRQIEQQLYNQIESGLFVFQVEEVNVLHSKESLRIQVVGKSKLPSLMENKLNKSKTIKWNDISKDVRNIGEWVKVIKLLE